MPLNKSSGNMYPWVTHMHSHLGGECPHKCVYCYVDNPRFGRPERYTGALRFLQKELMVDYGSDKTIFIEHQNDLFAAEVPESWSVSVFRHCVSYPKNVYVFQTKNPSRYLSEPFLLVPLLSAIVGTTIETNRDISAFSKAPPPIERMAAMLMLPPSMRKFVTIEPVLDFDVDVMVEWISAIKPEFLNLGADSKGHGLPEPTVEKIMQLVDELHKRGIELREKHNLQRLKKS